MQRLLSALVLAILIHAMVLTVNSSWLMRQKSIAPKTRLITTRLVERAPHHPPAIRSLPGPPASLPKPQPKPVPKKKPVLPKPKPVGRKTPAKILLPPPSPQPAPTVAAVEPGHEFSEPRSYVNPVKSTGDLPLSPSAPDSPDTVEDAATAPATPTEAVATVIVAIPRYSDNSPPAYPSIARRRGYEGTVIVEVFVREDGRVGDLRIAESSTYKLLDRSAVKAVRRWQFEPGMQAGKTVAMWVRVPVKFSLQ